MKPNDKFWRTKNGKMIHISEMDDNHLQNSMSMLVRSAKSKALSEIIAALNREERKRFERYKKLKRILEDDDTYSYFDEYDIIWEKYVNSSYWDLVYEKRKRENNLFR